MFKSQNWIGPYPNEEAALRNYWADNYTEIGEDVTDLVFVIVSPEVSNVMFPDPEEIENVREWSWEHWSQLMYIENILVTSHSHSEFRVNPNPETVEGRRYLDLANEKFIKDCDGHYVLTEKGWQTVLQLRRHQAEGKRIFDFEYS